MAEQLKFEGFASQKPKENVPSLEVVKNVEESSKGQVLEAVGEEEADCNICGTPTCVHYPKGRGITKIFKKVA
ncbi:MAG TPA: hypothetical protein VI953_03825 [Candidatus Paceibacterota bacterium]